MIVALCLYIYSMYGMSATNWSMMIKTGVICFINIVNIYVCVWFTCASVFNDLCVCKYVI